MADHATVTSDRAHSVCDVVHVMGTVVTFDVVVAGRDDDLHVALAAARAALRRADAVFSLWKPDSPVSRIRRGELAVDDAPREVAELFDRCRQSTELSNGWFDAFAHPGGFDPTGLVKGWAAARALDVIVRAGFPDAMVNAGGDVTSSGTFLQGRPWRVGIADPRSRARLLGVVELGGSIATSGTAERGVHLYDPRSRRFAARFVSASVTGPDLVLADALATALCVAGDEGFGFIESIDGYEALTCDYDGTISTSSGFCFAD